MTALLLFGSVMFSAGFAAGAAWRAIHEIGTGSADSSRREDETPTSEAPGGCDNSMSHHTR